MTCFLRQDWLPRQYTTAHPQPIREYNTQGLSSTQSKKEKGKQKMPSKVEVIQEMNNTIKKALETKISTQNLEFAKEWNWKHTATLVVRSIRPMIG